MANSDPKYLDLLPDEIKLKVLSYLSITDIDNLSTIPPLEDITYDIISNIPLCKTSYYGNLHFLTNLNRRELVTSLNITGLYWIAPDVLCKAVSNLVNLKCLYAIGTQFGYNTKHIKLFQSLSQLNSLSLMVHEGEAQTTIYPELPNQIVNLYLHFYGEPEPVIKHILRSSNLQELWIIHSFRNREPVFNFENDYKGLKLVVCMYPPPKLLTDRLSRGNNKKITFIGCNEEVIVEADDNTQLINNIYNFWFEDDDWRKYINGAQKLPFCVSDAKTLMAGSISPSQLHCTELNMRHDRWKCNDLSTTVWSLLRGDNMKRLEKLSISFCICGESSERLGKPNSSPSKSRLEDILVNCTLIKELEIWECNKMDKVSEESIMCISKLKNLEKLTLDFPSNLRGTIIPKLCFNLPKLTSLKIRSEVLYDRTITEGVCQALACLPHLKDLRCEQMTLDLDNFFELVSKLNDLKLERLVILRDSGLIYKSKSSSLDRFLAKNRQLRFLFISNYYCMQKVIDKYKTPWHAYFVGQRDDVDNLQIVDNVEMVKNLTAISALDPFSHYVK